MGKWSQYRVKYHAEWEKEDGLRGELLQLLSGTGEHTTDDVCTHKFTNSRNRPKHRKLFGLFSGFSVSLV